MKRFKIPYIFLYISVLIGILVSINNAVINTSCKKVEATVLSSYNLSYTTDQAKLMQNQTTYGSYDIPMHEVCGLPASSAPGTPTLHFSGYYKASNDTPPILSTNASSPDSATFSIDFANSPNIDYVIKSISITYNISAEALNNIQKMRAYTYSANKTLSSFNKAVNRGTANTTFTADPGEHITKFALVVTPVSSGANQITTGIWNISLDVERHSVTKHDEVKASCTESGVKEYFECTECSNKFIKDKDGSFTFAEQDSDLIIDPLGHKWETPQYTWSINNEHQFICDGYSYCLNDGCRETKSATSSNISHTINALPTSRTEGSVTYTATFENSDLFQTADLNITLPIFNVEDTTYKVEYVWGFDDVTQDYGCNATLTANVTIQGQNDYVELFLSSEKATINKDVVLAPTCVSAGIERYTAKFTKEYFDLGSTKDYEIPIDRDAHQWGEPTYAWTYPEGDVPQCTATIVCDLEESHVDIIEGITYSQVRTIPTPATPGKIIYVAKFFDDRCEDQEITVDVPPLNPVDCDIGYVWQINGDGEFICTGYATKKDDPSILYTETGNSQLVVEKPCTCSEDGYGHYESTFVSPIFEKQISAQVITIPSPGEHVYYDYWVYDKLPTTTETGLRSHHCKYCDHFIDQETVPVLTKEAEKETAKSIIRPQDPVEEVVIDEALEKIPQESLDEITDLVNTTMNDLNEQLEQAKAEGDKEKIAEIETKIEITQAVTKSSVVISSEKQDNLDAGAALSEILPEDSPIDLENIFDDFIQRQMELLLNKNQETKKFKILRQHNEETSEGVNFDISAETYNNAIEFVDDSIEHMEDAATRIRECSCEKLTVTIELYITSIQYSTFQDFDKEAADEEFVENAYSAIMLQMQSEVVTQLEAELQKVSTQLEKDPARENLIKEQIAAVQDMEQFEIMVMEILRQKYAVLTGYDVTLEEFEPVYRTMFRRWALNEEQDVDITLEELTTAVVDKKVNQDTVFNVNSSYLGKSEIILLSCLGGAFGALLIGVVTYFIIKKKKEAK